MRVRIFFISLVAALIITAAALYGVLSSHDAGTDSESAQQKSDSVIVGNENANKNENTEVTLTNESQNTNDTPAPIKRLVITAPYSGYQFPKSIRTSFDVSGDFKGGIYLNNAATISFEGRDLYVLTEINALIGKEVDPNAASIIFPASLRFSTDHDSAVNFTTWICGGAYMSDRDSYLLYALTQIQRGQNPHKQPFAFFGQLQAKDDATGSYTSGQCVSSAGISLEGRDRYLLDVINSMSITEETVQ